MNPALCLSGVQGAGWDRGEVRQHSKTFWMVCGLSCGFGCRINSVVNGVSNEHSCLGLVF